MGPGLLLLFSVLCSLLGLAATIETGPRRGGWAPRVQLAVVGLARAERHLNLKSGTH